MINEENSHWFWALGIAAMAVIAGLGYYYAWHVSNAPPPAARAPVEEAAPPQQAQQEPPPIQHPIEEAPAQPAEPEPAAPQKQVTLADSDAALRDALGQNANTRRALDILNPAGAIIRRFVATVDNLPRGRVASQIVPVQPVHGRFSVSTSGDALVISPKNAARYEPYVKLIEGLDTKALATIYVRHYGLFQEAYRELGYPKGYFNDRLVEVIDHLLDAPEIKGPIKVTQPKVLYEFADPELQALSAGQKAMVRIGPENAARVKAKLRDLRREITRRAPKG